MATPYLVILHLGNSQPQRLRNLVPQFQALIARLSDTAPEQAFRSSSGELFGYFIRSKLAARQIASAIQSPARSLRPDENLSGGNQPFLDNSDAVMVLEIGPEFLAGAGFTRAGTWLQRHPKSQ